jgi:Predicted pyridoxal phosphate-dependent enzyme apparently involved in regulation of cell wall biogenesis
VINVTKTYLPDIHKYQSYIEKIFQNGWLTNNAQFVQELQQALSEYLGVRNLLLVSNGTMALQVAYKVLNLKGKVITTPFSFVATTSSLVWENLQPVFADIDPLTFNIDPMEVEKKLSADVSGIVATHVYGNACDVEALEHLARNRGIPLVFDAAHAFGVRDNKQSILNYGDISIISFHSTKIFHTIEGGALVFKDRNVFERAKKMINFGIESPTLVSEIGINCKMNEMEAAMGLCVLQDVDAVIEARKARAEIYNQGLRGLGELQFQKRNLNFSNNYSHYPVAFRNEAVLLKIIEKMNKEGIFPRRYFYPSLNTLPYFQERQEMPVSEDLTKRIMCLPLFHDLDEAVQSRIISIIKENL